MKALLFMILFSAPVAWADGLNSAEQEALAELLSAATSTPYSHYGFSKPRPPEDHAVFGAQQLLQFEPGAKVGDLVNAQGTVILFRNINAPYVRGYVDDGNGYIAKEGRAYSYSLTPSIVKNWASPDRPESYSLIAVQNIDADGLKTKVLGKMHPGFGRDEHIVPLKRGFPIEGIAFYAEVKVPVEKEKVVAIVSQKDLAAAVDSFQGKPFDLRVLLRRVGGSPSFRSLRSWESRIPGSVAELKAAAKNFPAVEYGPERYSYTTGDPKIDMWGTKFHFPSGTKMADLANSRGDVFLFRAIERPYQKNFTNAPFVKNEFDAYSYSLSPEWVAAWGEGGMGQPPYDKHVLIALQNVEEDHLRYRRFWKQSANDPVPEHPRLKHRLDENGNRWLSMWPELELGMASTVTGSGSEVKVPVRKEKVVAVLPHEEFKRILSSFGGKKYSLTELMEKVAASSLLQLPNARAPAAGCASGFAAMASGSR